MTAAATRLPALAWDSDTLAGNLESRPPFLFVSSVFRASVGSKYEVPR